MIEYMYLSEVLFGIFCITRGEPFKITTTFWNGDLHLTLPNASEHPYYIGLSMDTNSAVSWNKTNANNYTLKDVTKYNFVKIQVRRQMSSDIYDYEDHEKTYPITAVESKLGDSQNISWTAAFFPRSGIYNIVHHNGSKSNIIKVDVNGLPPSNQKYVYHSRPLDSTNISFEVRNITVGDAGYYTAGEMSGEGVGVVLVVLAKPEKPVIKRPLNETVGNTVSLECESRSTSVPQYYKKLPPLSFMWYVNDTKLEKQTQKTYNLLVTRDEKYNHYSCQAKEKLESERSEKVLINPLYGPETIVLSPDPLTATLSIPDGKKFGPYNCSADCNPACYIEWKYLTRIGGYLKNASSIGKDVVSLPEQTANRNTMTGIQCEARGVEGIKTYNIALDIQYFMKPVIRLNGRSDNPLYIKEGEILNISCFVDGNPTPSIDLIRSLEGQILGQQNKNRLYYIKRNAQCSDVDIYTCTGKSQLGNKSTDFVLNIHCKPRLDVSRPFKTNYGSMSGRNVKVLVEVPVIANPFTSTSRRGISWDGPGHPNIINNTISKRDNSVYKHWINSTIPISGQESFGNYTLYYNGTSIVNITIKAEDLPKPPLNFTWNSDARGYVNLTWISNFNGGPEQFFILSHKQESGWEFVENLTDPGEGNLGYYDLGPLTPGLEYLYQLESCNRINCSLSPREVKVKVKAPSISSSSLFGDNTMLILVGASAGGFLLVVVLTLAVTMYCKTTKKPATKKGNMEERLNGSTVQDDTPADVVVYAAVDKSVLMKNRQQDDVVKSDVIKDQNDDNDTMYSEVIKHPKKQKQTDEKKKKNGGKELQGKNEEAGASTSNDNSRSTNQDGLVYIDVEFARKPPCSDTKGRPVIHGEEEKTEYTFVDFTQKAPPVQETQENVK